VSKKKVLNLLNELFKEVGKSNIISRHSK
jgi:hypothetical protein